MAELGGPSTQDGIYYQNTIAARHLADLLELTQLPPRERVVEVRIESPTDVDDIVIRFADGHRDWLQAKTSIQPRGDAWSGLWSDLEKQAARPDFGPEDRLAIVLGEPNGTALALRDLCERSATAPDEIEWRSRLVGRHRKLLHAVEQVLRSPANLLELLRRVVVEIAPLAEVNRAFERRRLGTAFTLPAELFPVLRDIAAGGARRRALFLAAPLRRRLSIEFGIELAEPSEWGLPAYRSALEHLARIELPGTGVSGPSDELFVWPRASDYDRTESAGFEDEEVAWETELRLQDVDFRHFPSDTLDRCIIVAGPGYGKSALLVAVAGRLARTPYVPVFLPLASLAASGISILEFLTNDVNREMNVRVDWLRLAEQGLLVLLFDGLDEIPISQRQRMLGRIATFSARHPLVPWLLTVRDPAALSGPTDARLLELRPVDSGDIIHFVKAMKSRAPNLDSWEFIQRIEAYPELTRLARIPLFLAMLVALAGSSKGIPANRADLIETYLKSLFSPHEHKPFVAARTEASTLRNVAEALAYTRIERHEIGATEREVQDVAARVCDGSPEVLLESLLSNGVLRRQSAIRLQFPYPIVQEYLAACYLVREYPETLAQRTDDALQRPWAQVIQFALELHPSPSEIVRLMLDRPDDAFATGLRLIGRCIANGAKVQTDLRNEVAGRLASAWSKASLRNGDRIGRLIVDGFSVPLSPEIRSMLSYPWLLHHGADEIVIRENDPNLTIEVLTGLLERGIDRFNTWQPLQPALDRIADDVLKIYANVARRPGTTADEFSGLSSLVGALDPNHVTTAIALDLALDETLPDELRLKAFALTTTSLDDRAWPIIMRVLRSDDGHEDWAALQCIRRIAHVGEVVLDLFREPTLSANKRLKLASHIESLIPGEQERIAFIHKSGADL